jgi:hypothetical protein
VVSRAVCRSCPGVASFTVGTSTLEQCALLALAKQSIFEASLRRNAQALSMCGGVVIPDMVRKTGAIFSESHETLA